MKRTEGILCTLATFLILAVGVTATALALPSPTPLLIGTQASATAFIPAQAANETIYIRGIQKELLAHGYRPGAPDGIAGPRTRDAIRAYQDDAGLEVDGRPSKRLLDHLKFTLPKVYTFGAPVTGNVLDVQRELAQRDYYLGPHDGLAGPATRRAVRWFLRDAQLPADSAIDSRLLQQIRDTPASVKADTAF
ncbi:MAG: peptidoglycan-binding protein [Kiloniellaceae bacterium]